MVSADVSDNDRRKLWKNRLDDLLEYMKFSDEEQIDMDGDVVQSSKYALKAGDDFMVKRRKWIPMRRSKTTTDDGVQGEEKNCFCNCRRCNVLFQITDDIRRKFKRKVTSIDNCMDDA